MDRIKDFPQDGQLWWVRWVDDVRTPFGRTASPGIFVLLSHLAGCDLDRLPWLHDESRRTDRAFRTGFALTGSTPGLAIGTVFRDGVRVGALKAEDIPLEFDSTRSEANIKRAVEKSTTAFPIWRNVALPYHLIPRARYGLPGFSRGYCLVIRDANQAMVIPCFEVFRSFYAPHGDIALALTRGLWASEWKTVANPDDTRVLPDGAWQIGLRRRIENEHAPLLANLILNPVGREAADEIFGSLLRNRQTPAQSQLPGEDEEPVHPFRGTETSFPLRARLPFEWDRLAIRARCIQWRRNPNYYFAFEITEITWPDAPHVAHRIDYDRDNSGRAGRDQAASKQARPFLHVVSELNLSEGEPVPVTADEDPRPEPTSVHFPVRGPTWLNVPPLRPVLKPLSFTYEDIKRLMKEPAVQASAGSAGDASSDAIRAQYVSVAASPLPGCFGQVVDALNRLQRTGGIAGWSIVCPPRDGIQYRGGILGWPVSDDTDKRGWCWIDKAAKRRRGALVCEVHLDGTTLLWLDLETRSPGEAFCALFWHLSDQDGTDAIGKLLRVAVKKQGVWPDAGALVEAAGIASVRKWKHFHDKENRSRLDLKSLLSALRKTSHGSRS